MDEIVLAVGRSPVTRDDLADLLDAVATDFLRQRRGKSRRLVVSELRKQTSATRTAVKKAAGYLRDSAFQARLVLPAGGISKSIVLRGLPGRIGYAQIQAAIGVLDDIERWCNLADELTGQPMTSRDRNRGDTDFNELLQGLVLIWIMCWNDQPSVSRSADKPGPFLRFVLAFIEILKQRLPANTIADDPNLKTLLDSSHTALTDRIRRITNKMPESKSSQN